MVDSLKATAEFYGRVGFQPPWIGYIALDGEEIVGGGAFLGPPEEDRVEIAYFTRQEYGRQGYASRTAATLISIARVAQPGIGIYAKTAPEPGPSPTLLERLGFERIGTAIDHEIGVAWAWRLS